MQILRGAALSLLLIVAACGRGPSRVELQDRVAELEDENDTLKQQLGEAQDQLDERRAKAKHASRKGRPAQAAAAIMDTDRPAHAARLEREIHGTAYPRAPKPSLPSTPAKPTREARNAATNAASDALIAASDARKAMAQR